jgi:hypothetical protein
MRAKAHQQTLSVKKGSGGDRMASGVWRKLMASDDIKGFTVLTCPGWHGTFFQLERFAICCVLART